MRATNKRLVILLLSSAFISLSSQAASLDSLKSATDIVKKPDILDKVNPQNAGAPATSLIQKIPLSEIESKLKSTKGLVTVHLSSNDMRCPYCVNSNPTFETLAQRHLQEVLFWSTGAEPYDSVLSSTFALANHITNIPATLMFKDGALQSQIIGDASINSLERLFSPIDAPKQNEAMREYVLAHYTKPFVPIPSKGNAPAGVETIDQNQLNDRIKNYTGIVVLNFSSYDANCGPCIEKNPLFDELAKRYEGRITFWRSMAYPLWQSAFESAFAKENPNYAYGVPTIFLIKNGQLLNSTARAIIPNTDILERILFYKRDENK